MALQYNHKITISGSTWDFALGNFAEVTLTADRTINVTNTSDMSVGVLHIIQGGSGNYVLTLTGPKADNWEILLGVGDATHVTFENIGGTLHWSMVGQFTASLTTTSTTSTTSTTTVSSTTTTTTAAGVTIDSYSWLQDFDVDAGDTFVDTGKVKYIVDRKNSGGSHPTVYDLQNGTLGTCPEYVANAINGFDAVHLGNSKYLANNSDFPSGPLVAPFEIHIVIDVQAFSPGDVEFITGVQTNPEHYILKHSTGNWGIRTTQYLTSSTTATTGRHYLRYIRRAGTADDELQVDGVSVVVGEAGTSGSLVRHMIGQAGGNALDCYLTRMCTHNGELTSGDATSILNSVRSKYNTP